jgi:hypothetical protein
MELDIDKLHNHFLSKNKARSGMTTDMLVDAFHHIDFYQGAIFLFSKNHFQRDFLKNQFIELLCYFKEPFEVVLNNSIHVKKVFYTFSVENKITLNVQNSLMYYDEVLETEEDKLQRKDIFVSQYYISTDREDFCKL